MTSDPKPSAGDQTAEDPEPSPGPGGIAPAQWGLMPDHAPTQNLTFGEFLRYWFVQYNPLYFFSALCVFAGVYLVAGDLDNLRAVSVEQAHFGLFAVIQLYELALIAGAAFLVHRKIGGRVAAILALLELIFIYDCSFRLESVAFYGSLGTVVSLGWVVLTAVKLWAMRLALALKVPVVVFAGALGGALGTAVTVQVLTTGLVDALITYQVAGWYGAGLVLMIRLARPRVAVPLAVLAADQIKVARALRAAPWVLGGFYFYHLWNHILWLGNGDPVALLGQIGILMLATALVVRQEGHIWLFGMFSVGLTAGYPPLAFAGALLAAAVFVLRVHQGAPERLLVSAVLLLYLAAVSFGWKSGFPFPATPGLFSWQTLLLVGGLVFLGWRRRQGLAWAVLGAGALYGLPDYLLPLWAWLPESALIWGAALLVVGFLALFVGLAVNWSLRGRSPKAVAGGLPKKGNDVKGGTEVGAEGWTGPEANVETAPCPASAVPEAPLDDADDLESVESVSVAQAEAVYVAEADLASSDMGPGGRIRATALLGHIESARMAWQVAMGWAPEPPDYRAPCEATELTLRIRRAVIWPERLRIETRVLTVTMDEVELEHTLISLKDAEFVGHARSRLAAVDSSSAERCPLPRGLHERIRTEFTAG